MTDELLGNERTGSCCFVVEFIELLTGYFLLDAEYLSSES